MSEHGTPRRTGRFFLPGENVLLRYVGHDGVLSAARPFCVVEDTPEFTALWMPVGTVCKGRQWIETQDPTMPLMPGVLSEHTWSRHDVLRMMYPGESYSVWHMWEMPERRFKCWYVNIEAPFVRTERGFDTLDYELDVVVRPDRSWSWKDEDRLKLQVLSGIFAEEQAKGFRIAGEKAIARLQTSASPFNGRWLNWTPGANLNPPTLPAGWDRGVRV